MFMFMCFEWIAACTVCVGHSQQRECVMWGRMNWLSCWSICQRKEFYHWMFSTICTSSISKRVRVCHFQIFSNLWCFQYRVCTVLSFPFSSLHLGKQFLKSDLLQ